MIRLSRAVVLVFMVAGLAQAQESMRTPAKVGADADILAKIRDINEREIGLGLLAQDRGSTLKVRSYGQRMAVQYRDEDREISALAKQLGVTVEPTKPAASEEDQKDALRKKAGDRVHTKSGTQFDTDFLHTVEQDHREAMKELRAAEARVSQAVLRNFLERKIMILQTHLDAAVAAEREQASK